MARSLTVGSAGLPPAASIMQQSKIACTMVFTPSMPLSLKAAQRRICHECPRRNRSLVYPKPARVNRRWHVAAECGAVVITQEGWDVADNLKDGRWHPYASHLEEQVGHCDLLRNPDRSRSISLQAMGFRPAGDRSAVGIRYCLTHNRCESTQIHSDLTGNRSQSPRRTNAGPGFFMRFDCSRHARLSLANAPEG